MAQHVTLLKNFQRFIALLTLERITTLESLLENMWRLLRRQKTTVQVLSPGDLEPSRPWRKSAFIAPFRKKWAPGDERPEGDGEVEYFSPDLNQNEESPLDKVPPKDKSCWSWLPWNRKSKPVFVIRLRRPKRVSPLFTYNETANDEEERRRRSPSPGQTNGERAQPRKEEKKERGELDREEKERVKKEKERQNMEKKENERQEKDDKEGVKREEEEKKREEENLKREKKESERQEEEDKERVKREKEEKKREEEENLEREKKEREREEKKEKRRLKREVKEMQKREKEDKEKLVMEKEEIKILEKKQRETRIKKDIDRVLREIQIMEEEEERSSTSLEDTMTPYLSLCSRLQLCILNCERYFYVQKMNRYHKRQQTLQRKSIKTGSRYAELHWLLEERRRLMVLIKQTEVTKEELLKRVWQRMEEDKDRVSSAEGEKEKGRGRRLYITWRPIHMEEKKREEENLNREKKESERQEKEDKERVKREKEEKKREEEENLKREKKESERQEKEDKERVKREKEEKKREEEENLKREKKESERQEEEDKERVKREKEEKKREEEENLEREKKEREREEKKEKRRLKREVKEMQKREKEDKEKLVMEKEEIKILEKKQRETRIKKDIDRVLREIQIMEEEEERSSTSLEETITPYLSLCSRLQLCILNCERYFYVQKMNRYHKRQQTLQRKSIKTGSRYAELHWLLEERRRLMVLIKQTEVTKEELLERVWQRMEEDKDRVSSAEGEKEKRRGRRLYITWRPIHMEEKKREEENLKREKKESERQEKEDKERVKREKEEKKREEEENLEREKKERETRIKKDIDRVLREIQIMEEEEERSSTSLEDTMTPYLSLCSRLQLCILNCERYFYVQKMNRYHKRQQTLQKKSIKTGSRYAELHWLLEERRRLMVLIKQTEVTKEELLERVWQRMEEDKDRVSSAEGEKEKRRGRRIYITWRPIHMPKWIEDVLKWRRKEAETAEAAPPTPPPTSPP